MSNEPADNRAEIESRDELAQLRERLSEIRLERGATGPYLLSYADGQKLLALQRGLDPDAPAHLDHVPAREREMIERALSGSPADLS